MEIHELIGIPIVFCGVAGLVWLMFLPRRLPDPRQPARAPKRRLWTAEERAEQERAAGLEPLEPEPTPKPKEPERETEQIPRYSSLVGEDGMPLSWTIEIPVYRSRYGFDMGRSIDYPPGKPKDLEGLRWNRRHNRWEPEPNIRSKA